MENVPSHMDHSYIDLVLLNMVYIPSNHVLLNIYVITSKVADDQQSQYEKNRANTGFSILALFISYWPCLSSYEASCFGCINAILS